MNLQYYFNYITIVEEGSLTAAARKLHIAQPALSNQIKAMEQKYGTRLFFRGSRRLELTDAGMILYQKAKRMCEIEQAAKNEIASGFSGQKGMLRLGVSPSVSGGKIADLLLAFAEKYPQTEIKFLEASAQDLYKMLQNGIVEVAILKTVGEVPENVKLLYARPNPTMALYKPGAGLLDKVKKDSVTINQLSNVPLAMEELYQGPVLSAFKAKDAGVYLKALSSRPDVSVRLARAGLAVALVSEMATQAIDTEGLAVKPISDGAPLASQFCLLAQRGNYRSQVVNNFLNVLAEAYQLDLGDITSAPEESEL